tara:strand:+ start:316 stop:570 length:255 start_codon:yes stop_codon:yes gene_type:complete
MKYIHTRYLEVIIYETGNLKLSVYSIRKSPYGWSPRELRASFLAVSPDEFTYDYVSNKVAEVYAIFSNEEIHDLLNQIKEYKNG